MHRSRHSNCMSAKNHTRRSPHDMFPCHAAVMPLRPHDIPADGAHFSRSYGTRLMTNASAVFPSIAISVTRKQSRFTGTLEIGE